MEKKKPATLPQQNTNEAYMMMFIKLYDQMKGLLESKIERLEEENEQLKGEARKYKELYLYRFN